MNLQKAIQVMDLTGIPYSKANCWVLVKKFYHIFFDMDLKIQLDIEKADSLKEVPDDLKQIIALRQKSQKLKNVGEKKSEEPVFGDIVVLEKTQEKGPEHFGVFINGDSILHTMKDRFSQLESLRSLSLMGYYVQGYYRPNGRKKFLK